MTTASRPSRPLTHTPEAWIRAGHRKAHPIELAGFTPGVPAPEGTVNIMLKAHDDGPPELFIKVGRAGSDVAALAETLGCLISFHLRLPSTMSQEERLRQAATQLRGIAVAGQPVMGPRRRGSLPNAVDQHVADHMVMP